MLLIGERIKELRMEKNMSQVRLGVELSVSQEAVSSYDHKPYARLPILKLYKKPSIKSMLCEAKLPILFSFLSSLFTGKSRGGERREK